MMLHVPDASVSNQEMAILADLSQDLLEKYNLNGPRYTSYPTAPMWQESFGPAQYMQALRENNTAASAGHPLAIYVHLPFCEHRCLFCGCNVVITRQREQAEKYLDYLFREIEQVAAVVSPDRPVNQFHWGGGTPTYLSPAQMERLFRFVAERFPLAPDAEIAIEIDPRVTTQAQLDLLYALGFNRISLGVQDFNPEVQAAVERIQPIEMTEAMVSYCRKLGFDSLNFDLIYGLPYQTVSSFEDTLQEVIRLNPERIAVYNYAHVPWISPHQKGIPEQALPAGPVKFQLFQLAMERLTSAGYRYIGMDHFARPDDALSRAQQDGTLHRNFMGYTTHAGGELYGFGVSAISGFPGYYAQNWRKLSQYYEAIDTGVLPTMRGIALSPEDKIRKDVIQRILCHGALNYADILDSDPTGIEFEAHFAESLEKLPNLASDGLLTWRENPAGIRQGFRLTPLGRIFSRNIAMAFDAYLHAASTATTSTAKNPLFSKTL